MFQQLVGFFLYLFMFNEFLVRFSLHLGRYEARFLSQAECLCLPVFQSCTFLLFTFNWVQRCFWPGKPIKFFEFLLWNLYSRLIYHRVTIDHVVIRLVFGFWSADRRFFEYWDALLFFQSKGSDSRYKMICASKIQGVLFEMFFLVALEF